MTWRHWVLLVWAAVVLILVAWALLTPRDRPRPAEPVSVRP